MHLATSSKCITTSNKGITTSNEKLLVARCIATSSKKLLVAKCIATSNKKLLVAMHLLLNICVLKAAASAAVRLAGFGRFLAKESQAGFIGFFDLGSHQHVQLHYPAHVCKLIL